MPMTLIMMWQKQERKKYVTMLCPMYMHMDVQCPKAKGIIHLGATSCYVGDNTDIIIMTEGSKACKKQAD